MVTTDETPTPTAERRCQWCAQAAPPKSTHCASCGAALPLPGSLGELVVAGVTDVDPELAAYGRRPLRIPRGSPTESLASGAIGAAAAGPAGVLVLGAIAAVAVKEFTGAGNGAHRASLDNFGQPSEPVLEMAKRLQAQAAEEEPAPEG